MKWKPYPSYKDSGVEWLGRIPAKWNVVRADAVLEYKKEQARRESFSGKRVFHYSIPAIQETGDGREENGSEIDSDKISLNGDELLVSKLNPRKGCVLISKRHELPVICSTEFVPLTAKRCDLRFAFYLYTSQPVRDLISATVQSVTRSHQRANPADIAKIWLAFPTDAEQQAIAAFLDRETGKIDALVKKKERLIELLQEKRTALISHAVTQGLNPNVPKKDSGIPWLGHIPEHWEVRRLKFLLHRIDQGFSPVCSNHPAENGQWGVLKAGCANGGVFDPTENKTLPAEIEPPLGIEVKRGDVLMSRASGSTELIGSVAIVREELTTRLLLSDKTFRLVLRTEKIDPELVVWAMGSPVLRHQISGVTSGAEGLASNIAKGDIYNLVFPLPPRHEQQQLCARISNETTKLDALMAKVRTVIERLQEYQTALIAAAVTGQIDVRSGKCLGLVSRGHQW